MAKRKDNFEARLDEWLEAWLGKGAPTDPDHLPEDIYRQLCAFAFVHACREHTRDTTGQTLWEKDVFADRLKSVREDPSSRPAESPTTVDDGSKDVVRWLKQKLIVPASNAGNCFYLNITDETLDRFAANYAVGRWREKPTIPGLNSDPKGAVAFAFVDILTDEPADVVAERYWKILVKVAVKLRSEGGEQDLLERVCSAMTRIGATPHERDKAGQERIKKFLGLDVSAELDRGVSRRVAEIYLSNERAPRSDPVTKCQPTSADKWQLQEFLANHCGDVLEKIQNQYSPWKTIELRGDDTSRAKQLVDFVWNRAVSQWALLCRATAAHGWRHIKLLSRIPCVPYPLNEDDSEIVRRILAEYFKGVNGPERRQKIVQEATKCTPPKVVWGESPENISYYLVDSWNKSPICLAECHPADELPCYLGLMLKYVKDHPDTSRVDRNEAERIIQTYYLLLQ